MAAVGVVAACLLGALTPELVGADSALDLVQRGYSSRRSSCVVWRGAHLGDGAWWRSPDVPRDLGTHDPQNHWSNVNDGDMMVVSSHKVALMIHKIMIIFN